MPPSQVWHYFKKVDKGRSAQCSICKKQLVYCGSTSSLAGHLVKCHKISTSKQNYKVADVLEISEEASSDTQASSSQESIALVTESPIVKAFQNVAAYTGEGEKTNKINDALLFMIAEDNMPFCAPEKRGFQKFIKTIQPLYKPPNLKTRQKLFDSKYTFLKSKMFNRLSNAANITITTDLWTETMNVKCFLGITAHYLDGIEIKSVDIGASQITERKTISNLKEALLENCKSWNITRNKIAAIVTDNGPNIVGASKEAFGPQKHIPCFAHTLNLVVTRSIDFYNIRPGAELPVDIDSDQDDVGDETESSELKVVIKKLKQIVSFFKRSESASTALNEIQKRETNHEGKRLIQEVRTRWNSLYEMISRYLEINDFVSRALRKISTEKSSKQKPPQDLTTEEINSLIEVQKLLKPFFLVTQELCSQKHITVSKVIPLIKMLNKSMENFLPIDSAAFELRRKLIFNLQDKFKNVEKNSILGIATILDPRFKKLHFSNDEIVETIVSKIGVLVLQKLESSVDSEQNSHKRIRTDPKIESGLWEIHDNIVETQKIKSNHDLINGIPVELRQYLNRAVCDRHLNPLEEWEKYKAIYPNIYDIAREYLCILATSVPCERLFSKAGLIVTQQRNRLSSHHINQQLFLQNLSEQDWFDN